MSLVTAQRYVARIEDVDVDDLVRAGVRLVLVDRDNTCVPRDSDAAPQSVVAWCDLAREAGLDLCLISNNVHTSLLFETAEQLGCDVITHAFKPSPHSLLQALKRYGVTRDQCVMIGDQIFTDVMAGNFARVPTILVHPQCPEDLWYAVPFRKFEAWLLRDHPFEGE